MLRVALPVAGPPSVRLAPRRPPASFGPSAASGGRVYAALRLPAGRSGSTFNDRPVISSLLSLADVSCGFWGAGHGVSVALLFF